MKRFLLFTLLLSFSSFLSAQSTNWFEDVTTDVGLSTAIALRINVTMVDGDKYPDLVVVEGYNDRGLIKVYLNRPDSSGNGRMFVDFTDSSGVNVHPDYPDSLRRADIVTLADVDNDGDNDMVTGIWHWSLASLNFQQDRSAVLLNDGNGHFTHVKPNGLDNQLDLISISGFAFTDYNADGNLDIYVSTFSDDHPQNLFRKDHLMQGNGDGTFNDVTSPFDIGTVVQPMYGVSAGDWNNDGYNDIFTSPYCRSSGTLWSLSPYGYFTDASITAGYDAQFMLGDTNRALCQWGAFPYDYDNDGDLDVLHVSVHGGLNQGEGRSTIANNLGPTQGYKLQWDLNRLTRQNPQSQHLGNMDASFFDWDNNMLVDMMMTENSYQPNTDRAFFYYQDSTNHFLDVTGDLGLLWVESPHSVETFDMDLDGDYDLITNLIESNNHLLVLENKIGQDNNWITISLDPPAGVNRNAIGARVYVTAGGVTQMREVQAGVGHFTGQQPFALTFGLGQETYVDSVVVRWPNNVQDPTVVHGPWINTEHTIDENYVGTDAPEPLPGLTVFPNPAGEQLFLSGVNLDEGYEVEVFDMVGKKMPWNAAEELRSGHYRFAVPQLPAGVYLLVVSHPGKNIRVSKKITLAN